VYSHSDHWPQALKNKYATVGSNCFVSPGITNGVQAIPANISHIKRSRLQDGKQQVYLLYAWVKDIEPPIDSKYLQLNTSVM
jgi:hypothetical protein